tara:strand:+ start:143 stop:1423 length:1281 start_codon:yes stop_codon:yes gene_type:complete
MNTADSERLSSILSGLGFSESKNADDANIVVLNSCVVRQSAEDKVTGMLTSLKSLKQRSEDTIVALMGCMVGPKTKALETKFPYVDVFMKPQEYEPLINLIESQMGIDTTGCLSNLQPVKPHISTHVPIIHGCDEFCSFCIIPYRRGRQVSREINDIVDEITLLTKRGVKEVTLLGQTVDAYGHDLASSTDLSELLQSVNRIDKLERIRFLTSHPIYMSNKIIDSIANLSKVCEHILLPFQAGADSVLKNMRRGYTKQEYINLVNKIRSQVPNVSMSTDVIVGFPGETQADFESTMDILEQIKFDKVHMAAYSPRPGTIAHRTMDDDVDLTEKRKRLKLVEQLQEKISKEINASLIGQCFDILVEGKHRNRWFGRTRTNKLVYFDSEDDMAGNVVKAHIYESSPWSLNGHVQDSEPDAIRGEQHGY